MSKEFEINDIKKKCDALECNVIAVADLLRPMPTRFFESSIDGVLGNGSFEEQSKAAYMWIVDNYEMVSAIIFAASSLAEMAYEEVTDITESLR